ncbi:MAG TPA: sulfatase-like hydrolase/transferase, partial [bacterium]|nr:sulfatase-like hydrolase/transferase [bacterium]
TSQSSTAFFIRIAVTVFRIASRHGRPEPAALGASQLDRAGNRSAVLVTIDTLRGDHLGYAGHPTVRSATLDRLSRISTVFTDARTNLPLTLPAHAAMFTSIPPAQLNVLTNYQLLAQDWLCLPEILTDNGFRTAGYPQAILIFPRGVQQGFEFYNGKRNEVQRTPREGKYPNREVLRSNAGGERDLQQQRIGEVTAWIAERDQLNERYFVWLHMFEPHLPYTPDPPQRYADFRDTRDTVEQTIRDLTPDWTDVNAGFSPVETRISRQLYRNEVLWADDLIRPLLQYVLSESPNPPFLTVTSDHGECLHDAGDYFGHGYSLSREELHVPLLICDPPPAEITGAPPPIRSAPGLSRGRIVTDPVQSTDIAPTILAALNLSPPDFFMGRNVMTPLTHRRIIPFGIGVEGNQTGAADTDYKVVWDTTQDAWFYWDRRSDPAERNPQPIPSPVPEHLAPLTAAARSYRDVILRRTGNPDTTGTPEDTEFMEMLRSLGYLQ